MKLIVGLIILMGALVVVLPLLERLGTEVAPRLAPLTQESSTPAEPREPSGREEGTFYRWRDADGTVHIESSPPPLGTRYESIDFVRASPPDSLRSPPPSPESDRSSRLDLNPIRVYTPEGIDELVNRVDETAKQMQQRREIYEQIKDDL